jgi:hypothetical protein
MGCHSYLCCSLQGDVLSAFLQRTNNFKLTREVISLRDAPRNVLEIKSNQHWDVSCLLRWDLTHHGHSRNQGKKDGKASLHVAGLQVSDC